MRFAATFILFVFLLILVCPVSRTMQAATIRVPADQPTIQAGIDAAADGDTVLVSNGTYTGIGNREMDFNGKAIIVRSANGPDTCVIDCEQLGRAFTLESGEGPDSVLAGFTITNGYKDNTTGGAVFVWGGSPTIIHNVFLENGVPDIWWAFGGALDYEGAGLVAHNVFIGNSARNAGAARLGGPVMFTNNLVVGNHASGRGGGVLSASGATITNCTIADNTAGEYGGGIVSDEVTLLNSIVFGNQAPGIGQDLYVYASWSKGSSLVYVEHSDIGSLHAEPGRTIEYGPGFIDDDPLFAFGFENDYYLSQIAAGQANDSPCLNAGNPLSQMVRGTTRTDGVQDWGLVDMGFHYPRSLDRSIVAGPGPALLNPATVRVFPDEQDADPMYEFIAYGTPRRGVNVTCGNVNGNDMDEILTGAGPGPEFGPHVRGFLADGTPLPGLSFLAYGTNKWGVNMAAGDIDGDGFDEILTGAGPGAVFGPHVRGFDYDGGSSITPLSWVNYFAYGTPKWGVNVAAGDLDGDGFDEIVTGAGPGAVYGPHVRGWRTVGENVSPMTAVSFMAYGTHHFGVKVSCGDIDGDGLAEIITGPGPSPAFSARIRAFDYDGQGVSQVVGFDFMAWPVGETLFGANVSSGCDLDNDGRDEVVVGPGPDPGSGTPVNVYRFTTGQVELFFSIDQAFPGLTHGTTLAAGRF